MHWRDIPFHPPTKTLRVFAGGLAILLSVFALWQFFAHENFVAAATFAGFALVFGLLGGTAPALLRPIFVAWMIAIFPVNWVVSRVLLACIFYLMVTPLGLFFRLIGRDFLNRRFQPEQDSYWTDKTTSDDVNSYLRPF